MPIIYFLILSIALQAAPASFDTSTWMRDLKSQIGDKPLNEIVIPGSHDSASDKIEYSNNPHVAIAQGQTAVPQIANIAMPIVAALSKAQNLSIYDQLKAGVRSLDLRVAWRDQKKFAGIFYDSTKDFLGNEQGDAGERGFPATIYYKNFWTHHTVYSEKFDSVLEQIKRFLDENKEELLILTFGNLYNMDNNRKNELVERIKNGLGARNRIAPEKMSPSTKFNDILKEGIRVIAFSREDLPGFWSGKQVCNGSWANTDEVKKLEEYLKSKIINHCQAENKLWNLSVTLTLQLGDAAQIASSVTKFGSLYNLDKTIEKDKILNEYGKKGLNVVTFDFINEPLARKIIDLNL